MKSTNRQTECKICDTKIDKSSCDNHYMIITEVNTKTIPVTNTRYYLCQDCRIIISSKIINECIKVDHAILDPLNNSY